MFSLLSFYKYVYLENPETIRDQILSFCIGNKLKGKIYVAGEGINANISGIKENVEGFKTFIKGFEFFQDIFFKEDTTDDYVFAGMYVRLKNELVNSGIPVFHDILRTSGKKISPEILLDFYRKGKDFVIVDVRNWYESRIGKFKNALTPQMKNFREWPEIVKDLKEFKDKTVITYCIGGIRCEKASAYLVHKGFKDVYRLDGGIISYIRKYPDTFWEGGVFVFDNRKVVEPNTKEELKYTAECLHCRKPSAYFINCHNLNCDKIFVVCSECKYKYGYCCSVECMKSGNRRDKYYD